MPFSMPAADQAKEVSDDLTRPITQNGLVQKKKLPEVPWRIF